jgi:glycine/D-amino acid oxidase-like deaminating enzyme
MMRTRPHPTRLPTTLASGLSLRWYPSFQMCPAWERLRDEPVDPELERRGIHVLLVQDEDGRVVVGDSHEYSDGDFPPGLDARTEELILREAGKLIRLPADAVAERWHGIYPLHRDRSVFTTNVGGAVHIVTGIGGKGMTTGPALARESIDRLSI